MRAYDVDAALRERAVMIVVGKGGVGKTTVAAVLAQRASTAHGRRVLVVDVEGKHELARVLGGTHLSSTPQPLGDSGVDGCTVAPDTALIDYLDTHGLGVLANRLVATGAVDVVAAAAPGVKDLLVLGRIKAYVQSGDYDLVVIDTPASGHAVTFLLGPRALGEIITTGTIRRQSDEVRSILTGDLCEAVVVTLPEETPVNEALETIAALGDRVGLRVGGVIVNAVLPAVPNAPAAALAMLKPRARDALVRALSFERSRLGRQREQIRRITDVATRTLPLRPEVELGTDDIDALADELGTP